MAAGERVVGRQVAALKSLAREKYSHASFTSIRRYVTQTPQQFKDIRSRRPLIPFLARCNDRSD